MLESYVLCASISETFMLGRGLLLILLLAASAFPPASATAQNLESPSRGKAFLLSLALPGLGHRYVHQGDWDGGASLFAAADVGLWLGLVGTVVRQNQLADGYRTLASMRAGADVSGKDRTFFLTVGSYRSSDEFIEAQLRSRAWDQIDYVSSESYQWEWQSEEDFLRFRSMREDAESVRRRAPIFAALLVGNRLVSGLLAIRAAGRADDADVSVSLAPSAVDPDRIALNLRARF